MLRLRLIRIVLALCYSAALCAPLAGCGACGGWAWSAPQKSCHDEGAR
jgi:hypothetical protein